MPSKIEELLNNSTTTPPKLEVSEQPSTMEWDGQAGFIETGPLPERPKTWDDFIRDAGLDPEEVEVVGNVAVRGWNALRKGADGQSEPVSMHHYKINLRLRRESLPDLPQLMAQVRSERPHRPVGGTDDSTLVVCFSDAQTGKVGSGGDSEDLIRRVDSYLEQVEKYSKLWGCKEAAFFDVGDTIEGIESGGGLESQLASNDLSLMEQIDLAGVVEFEFIRTLARLHDKVTYAAVPSNHCAHRRGKTSIGKPSDDWGLFIAKQISHRMAENEKAFGHVTTYLPEKYQETLTVDLSGTRVGVAHGHRNTNQDKTPLWWAKQTHGAQPLASADILVTGHYHNFRVQPTGSRLDGKGSKWWIQCPTMDNGSDWFRLASGENSEPSMLIFRVDESGWHDLTLLK